VIEELKTLWHPVPDFAVPVHIFKDEALALSFAELSVFLVACRSASAMRSNSECELPLVELQKITGYEIRQILRALKSLKDRSLLAPRWEQDNINGRFGRCLYELCDSYGEGLSKTAAHRRRYVGLRKALYERGVAYLGLPNSIIDRLDRLRGAPLAVYVSAVRLCNLAKGSEVRVPAKRLRTLAGVSDNRTFRATLDVLLDAKVLDINTPRRDIDITLLNPATGKTLDEERIRTAETGEAKNAQREHEYKPALLLQWAVSYIWPGTSSDSLKHGSGGDRVGHCPMCGDRNAKRRGTASLCINVEKRNSKNPWGVWFCHSCRVGGNLLDLVIQRSGKADFRARNELEALHKRDQVSVEVVRPPKPAKIRKPKPPKDFPTVVRRNTLPGAPPSK
jgi:hypothetical protein